MSRDRKQYPYRRTYADGNPDFAVPGSPVKGRKTKYSVSLALFAKNSLGLPGLTVLWGTRPEYGGFWVAEWQGKPLAEFIGHRVLDARDGLSRLVERIKKDGCPDCPAAPAQTGDVLRDVQPAWLPREVRRM